MPRPFFRQHEPLPTPDKWDENERRFAHKLEQLLDELYQLGNKVRLLLRGEKVNDMGLSQNSYTDAEKGKLESLSPFVSPVAVGDGGTGATTVNAALQNLGLAYKVNDTATVGDVQAAGHISSAGKVVEFTVYPPKLMNAISVITLTSLSACIRTTDGGYINGGAYRFDEYVGASGYTVSTVKANDNAFRVVIEKSTAFTDVTNNTPLAVTCHYTAKFT